MSRQNLKSSDLASLLSSEAGENLQATYDATELVFNDGDDGITVKGKERRVVKRWRKGEGVEESESDDSEGESGKGDEGYGEARSKPALAKAGEGHKGRGRERVQASQVEAPRGGEEQQQRRVVRRDR